MTIEVNCIRLYMQMNFTIPNEATNDALPSLRKKNRLKYLLIIDKCISKFLKPNYFRNTFNIAIFRSERRSD